MMADPYLAPAGASAGITIVREFAAPRWRVWKEWTEPERFATWFGAPETIVSRTRVQIDLRPGGSWQATTVSADAAGQGTLWSGRYLEVVEPERLVFTIAVLKRAPHADLVTVTFEELGRSQTRMLFSQSGWMTPEEYELGKLRWLAEFDCMRKRLQGA
jgi:uncharacterized protein YndB with AHSA1/START domain